MAHTAVPPEPPTSSPSLPGQPTRRAEGVAVGHGHVTSRSSGSKVVRSPRRFPPRGTGGRCSAARRSIPPGQPRRPAEGLPLPQVAGRPRDRPAGAHRENDRVDLAVGLLPELRPGRLIVRLGVGLVRVLVGLERAGDPLREPVGDRVVAWRLRRHRGRADDDLGPVAAQERALLLRDLVGHDEDAAVALDRGRDRQADPRAAARGLDDRAPGPQLPSRSAASIMRIPMRSFTLPPGSMYSSLASRVGPSPSTRCRRTSGVPPTRSSTVGYCGPRR